jgi:hypothetical protein
VDMKSPPSPEAREGNLHLRQLRRRLVVEAGVEPANGIAELIYSQRPLATWIFHHQKTKGEGMGVLRVLPRGFLEI